ncbi:hypothetical protein PV05_03188 [Exophiala xenobiotica]|uniref:Uncharacterized protein n=1 Tax=Exophiala xenobiotica TaxID=348802 RepID=A0A0D2FEZ3_9EURO|nr:uncharacterized protein PV05_03188 [Exophiala xenobiotica]KIW58689.1 hypothetical protein PV05_03188 [Exophiala xenobiotica]
MDVNGARWIKESSPSSSRLPEEASSPNQAPPERTLDSRARTRPVHDLLAEPVTVYVMRLGRLSGAFSRHYCRQEPNFKLPRHHEASHDGLNQLHGCGRNGTEGYNTRHS